MTRPTHARARDTAPACDDRPVLATAPLKAGHRREDLSRVGDPSWDLGPAVFRENAPRSNVTVHFEALEHADVQAAMRAYLYARMNIDRPGYRPKLPPASIRNAFYHVRSFFDFARERLGFLDFRRIDQPLIDAYAQQLQADSERCPASVSNLLQVVADLYHYRDHLDGDGLSFEPWLGRSPAQVAGYNYVSENLTPRIPEAVITPLLTWSLRYIADFAPDILAARSELDRLIARRDEVFAAEGNLPTKVLRKQYRARLQQYFQSRAEQGRGVAVWEKPPRGFNRPIGSATGSELPNVNFQLLNFHVGIDRARTPGRNDTSGAWCRNIIDAAVADLGVEVGGMDTPISIDRKTGLPWRQRFDAGAVETEERMLQVAAYVVCAYLTGMRDSEVQAMRRGCLSIKRSEDGLIERHCIRSTIYKSRSAKGDTATWVTIEPVADAIAVLEQLCKRAADARGLDTLWQVLSFQRNGRSHIASDIVRQLNRFRDHLNIQFGTAEAPAIPPGPDGKPWHITTKQFRRTIAWHIANRPFGTIAGMIQYKHTSVATFEGYSGSSASGFRAEVEMQRQLGQLDDLLDYFDRRQGGASLGGPAGPRIAKTLDEVADQFGTLPGIIADRSRLRVMLASVARTLYVGALADCFFDPATALCLKRVTTPDPGKPLTALCEPTRCPNACITASHRPVWERGADEARTLLREKRLSGLQRLALEQDLRRVAGVLAQIAPD